MREEWETMLQDSSKAIEDQNRYYTVYDKCRALIILVEQHQKMAINIICNVFILRKKLCILIHGFTLVCFLYRKRIFVYM